MRSHVAAFRRVLRFLILVLLVLIAAYWHWGLLPGTLKQLPIDIIRRTTGFEADFRRVHYIPFYGIRIDQPVLKGKKGEELFRARSIRLATDLPAWIQDDRIIIRKIEVDSAVTEFRLSAPAKPAAPASEDSGSDPDSEAPVPVENPVPHPFVVLEAIFDDSFLPSNVYLNELEIKHGRILILPSLRPEETGPPSAHGALEPVETLKEIYFRTLLDRRPLIPVEARFRTSFSRGDLQAEGLVNLADGRHRLHLSGNIGQLPRWLRPQLAARNVWVDRLRGDVALDVNYDGVTLLTYKLVSKKADAGLRWGSREVQGECGVTLNGSFDFSGRRLRVSDGLFEARDVTARKVAAGIDEVRLSSASVAWNPELIEIPRVQGTWDRTRFTVEGTVDRSDTHRTRLRFRQTLTDLEVWRPFAPKIFDHALNVGSLKGDLKIDAELAGVPSELTKNIRKISIEVRKGRLAPDPLKSPLTDINGDLRIEDMSVLSAEDLFFRHADSDYTLSGQYNTAPGGAGRLSLATRKWEVGARFRSFPDRVEFSTLTVESGPSHAGASGTLLLLKDPVINADFRAHAVTERLAADWQKELPWLKGLKLKGVIDGKGHFQGSWKKLTGFQLRLEANSKRLTYADLLTFEPIEADLRLNSGILEILYAKAGLYGGEARATGRADLTNLKRPYFETHVFTTDTDLARLSASFPAIKNKFSGLLNLDVTLSGLLNDPKTFTGHGSFRASDGELWETELFKRLRKVAFVTIEGAEKVIFNKAVGSFTVQNGGLNTEDLTLSSKLIDIHFTGRIGFDATVALNVVSRFTSDIIQEASEVGGLTPALINIAENKITRYLISGTLKEPTFTAQS